MEFQNLDTVKLKTAAGQWANDIKKDAEVTISKITLYHYRANIFLLQRFAEKKSDNQHITPLRYAMIFEILCPGQAATKIMSSKNFPLYCPHIAINDFVFRFTSHMVAARVDLPAFAVDDIKEAYKTKIPENYSAEWVFLPHCTAPGGGGIKLSASLRTDEPAVVLYEKARLAIPGQKNRTTEQLKPCSFYTLDIPFLRSIADRWANDYQEEGVLIDRITLHPMGIPPSLKQLLNNPCREQKHAVVFHCPECTSDDVLIHDTAADILDKISGDGFSPYHALFSATQELVSGSVLFYESFENVYLKQPSEDWQKEWRFVLLYSEAIVGCDIWQDTGIELYKAGSVSQAKENHQTANPITDTITKRLPEVDSEKNGRNGQDDGDQGTSIDDNMAISLSNKKRKEFLGDPTVLFDSRNEALEKNLWDTHFRPIVDLHFNSASSLQYEYFPEPPYITQGDLNSMWNTILLCFHSSDYEPEDIKEVMFFLAAGMPDTKRNVSIDELKQIFHPLLKGILEDKTLPSFLMFLYHECDVKPCKGAEEPFHSKDHQTPEALTKETTEPVLERDQQGQVRRFIDEGATWRIQFDGITETITYGKPIEYILELLRQPPGKEISCVEIVQAVAGVSGGAMPEQGGGINAQSATRSLQGKDMGILKNLVREACEKYINDPYSQQDDWTKVVSYARDNGLLVNLTTNGDLVIKPVQNRSSVVRVNQAQNTFSKAKKRFLKKIKNDILRDHFEAAIIVSKGCVSYGNDPDTPPKWNIIKK
jgi:hypothetical protein